EPLSDLHLVARPLVLLALAVRSAHEEAAGGDFAPGLGAALRRLQPLEEGLRRPRDVIVEPPPKLFHRADQAGTIAAQAVRRRPQEEQVVAVARPSPQAVEEVQGLLGVRDLGGDPLIDRGPLFPGRGRGEAFEQGFEPRQFSSPRRAQATMWSATRKLFARIVSVGAAPPEVGMKLPSTTKRF